MNARRIIGCMGAAMVFATPPAIAQTMAELYSKHSCAVVKITTADGTVGNGFFADAHGLLVTSAQVVFQHSFFKTEAGIGVDIHSKGPITLLSDDGRRTTIPSPPVDLHHADNATKDLAAIDTGLATPCFIPMASTGRLHVGDPVVTIAFPPSAPSSGLYLGFVATKDDEVSNIVGVIDGTLETVLASRRLLRVQMPVTYGISGAPIIDEKGMAVGVVASTPLPWIEEYSRRIIAARDDSRMPTSAEAENNMSAVLGELASVGRHFTSPGVLVAVPLAGLATPEGDAGVDFQ
ncbi:MAG: serine protease [Reyranella sp.]|nr:serine protease [Reyranella sp.]